MADALLSPGVSLTMAAVSGVALGYACYKMRKQTDFQEKLPILAMAGAFVFAAQMINFTIPGTGSSGHIGGGLLLAALLGSWPALITISVVLLIQCLLFADGGLLALGCNIFNMGVLPCLCIYPLFKKLLQKNVIGGTLAAALISLPLGAFAVVLETTASGITTLPFLPFTKLMIPIHIAIALGEGIATAAVLTFIAQTRPQLLDFTPKSTPKFQLSKKAVAAVIGITALCLGVVVSAFASSLPDGLEWAIQNTAHVEELEASGVFFENAAAIQNTTSFFPDYELADASFSSGWLAALVGILITAAVAFVISRMFTPKKA